MSLCVCACASVRCMPMRALCNVRMQVSSYPRGVLVQNRYGSCVGACANELVPLRCSLAEPICMKYLYENHT